MNNGVQYTSTKPLEEFDVNKKQNLHQTCFTEASDLISRQSAIEAAETYEFDDMFHMPVYREMVSVDDLRKLPSAQAEQRWIPVDEALPDDGDEVWVTIKGHDVIKCEYGETIEQAIDRISNVRWVTRAYWCEEDNAWNDPSFGCPLIVQPIAWMPIFAPEPYKGEQNE